MNTSLYILGTSHDLQCRSADCTSTSVASFEADLRTTCHTLGIRCIAEEMTQEGLTRYNVTKTVGERMARDMAIPHQYVDLGPEERHRLSLDNSAVISAWESHLVSDGGAALRPAFDKLVDGVRERCWSPRILTLKEWPVLFVCGADHIKGVNGLWNSLGLHAKVVHEDYTQKV
jgi:hypothetical protein